MRTRFLNEVRSLAAKALANGGVQESPLLVRWNIAGDCSNPYTTEVRGRTSRRKDGFPMVLNGVDLVVQIETRCRQCDDCRRSRKLLWSYRARAEIMLWPRTWFGTLTLRPEAHYQMLLRATTAARARAVEWSDLSDDEQWRRLEAQSWREIKLMLKRIAASYPGSIRYFIVTERHKSGLPHYHALVHQCSLDEPLRYAALKGQWPHGFTNWKLVPEGDTAPAHYVGKYLSKAFQARVRASVGYGSTSGHREVLPLVDNDLLQIDHENT